MHLPQGGREPRANACKRHSRRRRVDAATHAAGRGPAPPLAPPRARAAILCGARCVFCREPHASGPRERHRVGARNPAAEACLRRRRCGLVRLNSALHASIFLHHATPSTWLAWPLLCALTTARRSRTWTLWLSLAHLVSGTCSASICFLSTTVTAMSAAPKPTRQRYTAFISERASLVVGSLPSLAGVPSSFSRAREPRAFSIMGAASAPSAPPSPPAPARALVVGGQAE